MAGAIQRGAGVVQVDTLECGGKAVGVALAADLAIGDDVQPGVLLGADRHQRGIVLGLGQIGGVDAPQFLRPDPRRKASGQFFAIDQPFRLRIAANKRGGEQHAGLQRMR